MRTILIVLCLAASCAQPTCAQTFIASVYISQSNGCTPPAGRVALIQGQALCALADTTTLPSQAQRNVDALNALNKKVSDLTAENDLLKNDLKDLSAAIDSVTARLNKAEAK